jgi:hypothetical protein
MESDIDELLTLVAQDARVEQSTVLHEQKRMTRSAQKGEKEGSGNSSGNGEELTGVSLSAM